MNENNICCILNYAPHYREEIFLAMEKELKCDFYFGDSTYANIKKLEYGKFENSIKELKFKKLFNHFYLLHGQIKLAFKDYKYYIITGQPYNISSWLLLIINRLKGKKTYIWNHGWYGNENVLKKTLKKIQLKFASGYLLYGNYAKKLMVNEGFKENKLFVIYNSLFYSKQLEIREKLSEISIYKDHFKNNCPTIIFIGRLTSVKKLDMLLEVMKSSSNKITLFNLVFVGTGKEKESLEQLVLKYGLKSNVWFYGDCYNEEKIGELIFNASICVSPGNIGLTAIHSLMYGTPSITHDNFTKQMPEFEVIEKGVTGDFFKENDIESLKKTINNWLVKHPKKNDQLIQNCYSIIDRYYNPKFQMNLLKNVLQ